mmetsp:Transcript_65713/g.182944  ORF Transcript_65713/g.182944 Transcript_65713/m.182944 type:complete len:92 (-) Transcript_65713:32-307(-)
MVVLTLDVRKGASHTTSSMEDVSLMVIADAKPASHMLEVLSTRSSSQQRWARPRFVHERLRNTLSRTGRIVEEIGRGPTKAVFAKTALTNS